MNPYDPPGSPKEQLPTDVRIEWTVISASLGVAVLGGSLLGAATNIVNGYICPQYFCDVMGWRLTPDVCTRAIAHGALEGMLYAVLGTGLLVAVILWLTHSVQSTRAMVRIQLSAFAFATMLWFIGGITAVLFAWHFPEQCNPQLFGYTRSWPRAGYYAWVRGSIFGAEIFGTIPAVLISLRLNAALWRN